MSQWTARLHAYSTIMVVGVRWIVHDETRLIPVNARAFTGLVIIKVSSRAGLSSALATHSRRKHPGLGASRKYRYPCPRPLKRSLLCCPRRNVSERRAVNTLASTPPCAICSICGGSGTAEAR